jgi:hypothetical protein
MNPSNDNSPSDKNGYPHLERDDDGALQWNDPPTKAAIEDLVTRAYRGDCEAMAKLSIAVGPLLVGAAQTGLGSDYKHHALDVLETFYRMVLAGELKLRPDRDCLVHSMCASVQRIGVDERDVIDVLDLPPEAFEP